MSAEVTNASATSVALDALRSRTAQWIDAIPVAEGIEVVPAEWVASLTEEALWLAIYQNSYALTVEDWDRVLDFLVGYADLELPSWGIAFEDEDMESHPYLDEKPLVEAVLQIISRHGTQGLTLEKIASYCHRSVDHLLSNYDSINDLLSVVVDEIIDEGFDYLSPLSLGSSKPEVEANIAALSDSRKVVAMVRLYALSGLPRNDYLDGVEEFGRDARELSEAEALPIEVLVAGLATIGWRQGQEYEVLQFPADLPAVVIEELRRLNATS